MPDIIKDPITGEYRYNNCQRYGSFSTYTNFNHWNEAIKQYYHDLYSIRILPQSPIKNLDQIKTDLGYFNLDDSKLCRGIFSEQDIICREHNTPNEKPWPERIEIKNENGVSVPHYFRAFDMTFGIDEEVGKIISNVICGRLFPTQMPYYIGKYNGQFGTIGIDLNNLNGVKALRLDHYLSSKGIELDSAVSLIRAYRTGAFKDELTDSAIAQLMFSMYTIPNAIGEQDPNTRNAILLGPDKPNAKFDSLVRIDFERNKINDQDNRVYPLGIFHRDEIRNEYRENIVKALKDKILTPADASMILTMNEVTKYATASRTNIDHALSAATTAHERNNPIHRVVNTGHFANHKLTKFAENLHDRALKHTEHIEQFFNAAAIQTNTTIRPDPKLIPSLEK